VQKWLEKPWCDWKKPAASAHHFKPLNFFVNNHHLLSGGPRSSVDPFLILVMLELRVHNAWAHHMLSNSLFSVEIGFIGIYINHTSYLGNSATIPPTVWKWKLFILSVNRFQFFSSFFFLSFFLSFFLPYFIFLLFLNLVIVLSVSETFLLGSAKP